MLTADDNPVVGIPHAARCTRPAPMLRLSWRGLPEMWCASCGRCAPAPDTRPARPEARATRANRRD